MTTSDMENPARARSLSARRGSATSGSATSGKGATSKVHTVTTQAANGRGDYVVPVAHFHVSERVVDAGFWGALIGASVLGVVELPLAALIGAGVLVARHRVLPGSPGSQR
jgi:hypothetical protein